MTPIWNLASMPSEFLSLLLSGSCSHLALMLWKCGDTVLNTKLAHSVLEIDLKDKMWTSTSRYPKLLSSFTKLRYLSINRNGAPLMASSKDLSVELQKLPPTLLTLKIAGREAEEAFYNHAPEWTRENPAYVTVNYELGPSQLIDLQRIFPKLNTLEISGAAASTSGLFLDRQRDVQALTGISCFPALPR